MKNYARLLWLAFFAMLIAVGLLLVPGVTRQATAGPATVIDHFDVSQSLTADNSNNPVSSTVSGAPNLIGGYRKMWVYRTSGSQDLKSDANSPSSRLSHNPEGDARGITKITWDGTGGDPTVLNFSLNANLSSEDGIAIGIQQNDFSAVFTITLYTTDATRCSRAVKTAPANNDNFPMKAVFFKFGTGGDFSTPSGCTGGAATLSDVDAIVFEIDTTAYSANDVILHIIEATKMDFGDLPNSYDPLTLLPDGATHVYDSSLKLGTNWDAEADGQESSNAVLDDNTGTPDDEDGVLTYGDSWAPGQTVSFTVRVNGDGCLSGWIDWNKNNTFAPNERVITNTLVSTGIYTYTLVVPSRGQSSPYTYYARFRLFSRNPSNGCPDPITYGALPLDTAYYGGEVEDHLMGRAPTAVTLSNLSASAGSMDLIVPLVGIVGGVGILGLLAWRRRRN